MLIFKADFRRCSDFLHSITSKRGGILNAKKAVWSLTPYSSFLVKISRTVFFIGFLEALQKSVMVFSKAVIHDNIISPKLLPKCVLVT